jgi:L,D-peptidoglycan transpeptidase YkuD (ErfK/YbiS/YcfS/YnhG family)
LGARARDGSGERATGATPIGRFALRRAHYRADRLLRPRTGLALRPIRAGDWWADDPADRAYNRLVTTRPAPPESQEWLNREDGLYDVIVEIGFNDRPVVQGRGSGIFWHVARQGFSPTAGCVATTLEGLRRALPLVGPRTRIRIG